MHLQDVGENITLLTELIIFILSFVFAIQGKLF